MKVVDSTLVTMTLLVAAVGALAACSDASVVENPRGVGGAADAAGSPDTGPSPSGDACVPSCVGKSCGSPDGCGEACVIGAGCSTLQDAGSTDGRDDEQTPDGSAIDSSAPDGPEAEGGAAGDTDAGPQAGTYWRPSPGTSWQYQLSGTVDTSVDALVYDIDLFEVPIQTMAALQAQGRKVVCYFSAGSYEEYRPDAASFPESVRGNPLDGWAGEWWLDIRSPIVRELMLDRMDLAVQKGCDGVDPDLVDGYSNDNGLGLTAADQLDYNKFLAESAHARNLTILLKNDPEQVAELVGFFDGAVNEECFQYDECDLLLPFIDAGKPVFGVEYQGSESTVCPDANSLNFDTLLKHLSLNAYRVSCR